MALDGVLGAKNIRISNRLKTELLDERWYMAHKRDVLARDRASSRGIMSSHQDLATTPH